jgi:hypothetical protein
MENLEYALCPNCKLNVPYMARKCHHCHEFMPEQSKIAKKIAIGATIVWTVFAVSMIIYIVITENKPMPGAMYIIIPISSLGMYLIVKSVADRFINWIR